MPARCRTLVTDGGGVDFQLNIHRSAFFGLTYRMFFHFSDCLYRSPEIQQVWKETVLTWFTD